MKIEYSECFVCKGQFSKNLENGICPDCEENNRRNKIKQDRKQAEMTNLFGEKGLRDFRFTKFIRDHENTKAFEFCNAFIPGNHNVYLFGNPGSGKTHLAYSIALKYFEQGLSVGVWNQPDFMRHMRNVAMTGADAEEREIRRISSLDVLVIDDIGVGKSSDFTVQILYEIVNKRIMNLKNGLVITSNLHPDDMAIKLDDARLSDRLTGICNILRLSTSESWRRKNRNVVINMPGD